MTAPAVGYDIAAVVPADYTQLARFLAEFGGQGAAVPGGKPFSIPGGGPGPGGTREFWLSRFRLWWDENPAFRPESPRGWMLRRRGEFCGFLANAPSLMLAGGRVLQVFSVSTWMVGPEHRDASLDLLFKQMESCKGTLLFDTTPTELVAAIIENLGFERLPWGGERESFVALRPAACLKARFAGGPFLPDWAWRGAGWLFGKLQGVRLGPGRQSQGLRVEGSKEAGPAFDRLWERTKGLHGLTNVRSGEVLRWHCFADAHVEKKLFSCWAKDEVVGWMIAKVRPRRGLRSLEVVDHWADPSVQGTFEALTSFLVSWARESGHDLLTFGHFSPAFEKALRSAGLLETSLRTRRRYCLVGPGCPVRVSPQASYFTGLQGDYGTSP
ncbi:MAG: hypothetical protein HY748_01930 [Elusimicrobia bacterium]|nr:hypothetical protein [Elusimicrobiota bacterium]